MPRREGPRGLAVGLRGGSPHGRRARSRRCAASGHSLDEIAILVRAGFQTRAFEERLITLGVPYRVVGGLRFYERAEIRDAMAYLRVIAQPADDLAFERIVNTPEARPRRHRACARCTTAARARGHPAVAAAAALAETGGLKAKPREALGELMQGFARWREVLDKEGHVVAAATLLDESGYTDMWKQDKSAGSARSAGEPEGIASARWASSRPRRLPRTRRAGDGERRERRGRPAVSLMTLHGAKGLEFDTVFLPGWEEGLFPHPARHGRRRRQGLEEERRLAYVGITRARKRAIISHAANRRIYGNWPPPSPAASSTNCRTDA